MTPRPNQTDASRPSALGGSNSAGIPMARPAHPAGRSWSLRLGSAGAIADLSARDALTDVIWVATPLVAYVGLVEPLALTSLASPAQAGPMPFWALLSSRVALCALLGLLIAWRLACRGQPAASIGWTARNAIVEALIGLPAAVAMFALTAMIGLWIVVYWPDWARQAAQSHRGLLAAFPPMSMPQRVALSVFVALAEELFFRGLLLHRLAVLCRQAPAAIALQALLFALPHAYEGITGVFMVFGLGLTLGGLTWWRGSLTAAIVGHAGFNTIQLTLLDVFLRAGP